MTNRSFFFRYSLLSVFLGLTGCSSLSVTPPNSSGDKPGKTSTEHLSDDGQKNQETHETVLVYGGPDWAPLLPKDRPPRIDIAAIHPFLKTKVSGNFEHLSLQEAMESLEKKLGRKIPYNIEAKKMPVTQELVVNDMPADSLIRWLAAQTETNIALVDKTIVFRESEETDMTFKNSSTGGSSD